MKVTCEATQNGVQYPRLVVMHSTKRVILMTSANTGVCVCNPEGILHGVGYYCTDWYSYEYESYDGVVTLQND